MSQIRLIGVGAFVIGGLVLFGVGLFLIGNRRMLFTDRFEVYAEFAKVTGLQRGAIVRVSGMDAGEVEAVLVPPTAASRFRVQMRVREDLHHLVRGDSIATIQTDGLVGNKFVQIEIGTEKKAVAASGSTIPSREPFDFADLMTQASDAVKTLDQTVQQLRGNVNETLDAITQTANQATSIIDDLGDDLKSITANGNKITRDIQAVTERVRSGHGTIGRLVSDDQMYDRVNTMTKDAAETLAQMRKIVEDARKTLDSLNASVGGQTGPVQSMTADLRQTMMYAREAMADLAENSESLKRNFFFRGLFRGRGYYDLDTVTIQDYRAGDFAGKDREPLRIWLDAAFLFTKDPSGVEVLTADGKQRLDAAMATFLRYPKQMPLMVEGYAGAPTESAAHLQSLHRASTVREYLIRRFSLNPNSTGMIAMDARAEGSPRGDDKWEGVGLTLWVNRGLFSAPSRPAEKTASH